MNNLYLETQRLIIREYTYEDLVNVNKLMSNPVVMKYLDRIHDSIINSQVYIEKIIENKNQIPCKFFKMAIDLKSNNSHIGMVSI